MYITPDNPASGVDQRGNCIAHCVVCVGKFASVASAGTDDNDDKNNPIVPYEEDPKSLRKSLRKEQLRFPWHHYH
jgi:hypothetical protein